MLLALWAGLARGEVGYWRDAESLFSRALEVTGDNWLAHTNLGLALYERGEHERAIPHLAAAVRATPDLYPAVLALGTSYAERGDYPRAFPLLARAVQLAPPEDRMPRRNLAELLVRLGQTQSAIVVLEEHLVLHPDDARSRARLAELREGRAP